MFVAVNNGVGRSVSRRGTVVSAQVSITLVAFLLDQLSGGGQTTALPRWCIASRDTLHYWCLGSLYFDYESQPMDVGSYIRQKVMPPGMSVTEAAKQLRVGRPALSNLLNGNSSLSQKWRSRLERAFGTDRQTLLDLQGEADRDRRREEDRHIAVGTYAPAFLQIKARQISDWAAGNISARQQLPVLLRRLIHSTGRGLQRVDFPGYDNAERPGWDGWVEADVATPWIPDGKSGWELGTGQTPKTKADRDYFKTASNTLSGREGGVHFCLRNASKLAWKE